ncbi:MAG: hypothetical protein ABR529_15785 [Actinomycetota bacterium]
MTKIYGTDPEVRHERLTGRYVVALTPDQPGPWRYRWEGTGPTTARFAGEGIFMVLHGLGTT